MYLWKYVFLTFLLVLILFKKGSHLGAKRLKVKIPIPLLIDARICCAVYNSKSALITALPFRRFAEKKRSNPQGSVRLYNCRLILISQFFLFFHISFCQYISESWWRQRCWNSHLEFMAKRKRKDVKCHFTNFNRIFFFYLSSRHILGFSSYSFEIHSLKKWILYTEMKGGKGSRNRV